VPADVRRHHDTVVHPLTIRASPRRSLRAEGRRDGERFSAVLVRGFPTKVADTELLIAHEVQEPKPCLVAQGLEETLHVECRRLFTMYLLIRIDECNCKDIVGMTNMFWRKSWRKSFWSRVKSKYGAVAESDLSNNMRASKRCGGIWIQRRGANLHSRAPQTWDFPAAIPPPTAIHRPGEVIVDLGSGGGLDVFLASKMVDRPDGRSAST